MHLISRQQFGRCERAICSRIAVEKFFAGISRRGALPRRLGARAEGDVAPLNEAHAFVNPPPSAPMKRTATSNNISPRQSRQRPTYGKATPTDRSFEATVFATSRRNKMTHHQWCGTGCVISHVRAHPLRPAGAQLVLLSAFLCYIWHEFRGVAAQESPGYGTGTGG